MTDNNEFQIPGQNEQAVGANSNTDPSNNLPDLTVSKSRVNKAILASFNDKRVNHRDAITAIPDIERPDGMSDEDYLELFRSTFTNTVVAGNLNHSQGAGTSSAYNGGMLVDPIVPDNFRQDYLDDKDSAFTNNLTYVKNTVTGDELVHVGAKSIQVSIRNKRKIAGRFGMQAAMGGLDVVTPGSVYLPDSLVYLSHVPLDLDSLALIDEEIADNKDTIGKWTGGIGLTTPETYINETLWRFLLSCTKGSSIEGAVSKTGVPDVDKLLSVIKVTDMVNLYASHLASIKPNGENINIVCNHQDDDGNKCGSLTTMRVNFRNALWQNASRLTTEQFEFLAESTANESGQHSIDEILAKQEGIKNPFDTVTLSITDDEGEAGAEVEVTFWNPDCAYWLDTSNNWVSYMIDMIKQRQGERYLGLSRRSRLSRELLQNKARLSLPWIKSIRFIEENKVADDWEAIDEFLKNISSYDDVIDKLEAAVAKFQEYCGITVAAIRALECDTCGEVDVSSLDSRATNLISFDMVSSFFTLCLPTTSTVHKELIGMEMWLQKVSTNE